jgi:hypothetical protein
MLRGIVQQIRSRSFATSARTTIEARGIVYEQNGEPSKVIRGHQWTLPKPEPGQVLLKVGLASINPAGESFVSLDTMQ